MVGWITAVFALYVFELYRFTGRNFTEVLVGPEGFEPPTKGL
jgi:hypothetical protein